ncbi:hypothetical protein [Streptomyces sp. NPDC058247]|uniref:hypothetical protein n=1 Tax=Streptomyces sp. NPDC058247 TaxID=3346401 RepID=UPI0036EB76A5
MGNDPFANMSHEEMLAWLDKADPAIVQAGAAKLVAAAKEIEKIAGELKTRPQYVTWKGKGAESFRAWGADLANATLRISDYSTESGNFLTHAADAIARTKSSIPRHDGGAQANIDAAKSAPNDPGSADVLAKATAQKEAVRQQAADEMTKLGQTYQQSAERLTALKPPKVPPPPDAIVPEAEKPRGSATEKAFPGATSAGSDGPGAGSGTTAPEHAAGAAVGAPAHPTQPVATEHGGEVSTGRTPHVELASVPHTSIDSAATLPDTRTTRPATGTTSPAHGPATSGPGVPNVPVPPMPGGTTGRTGTSTGSRLPSGPSTNPGQGRAVGTPRPSGPGQGTARPRVGIPGSEVGRTTPGVGRATGATPYGRTPGNANGIYGGRPSQPQAGRTTPYRGTVVGGETAGGTTPGGRTAPGTAPGGRSVPGGRTLPGTQAGGRTGSAAEPVNGRAVTPRGQAPAGSRTPSRGAMGTPPAQRQARTAAGERAVPGSASLSRDGIAGGSGSPQRDGKSRRKEERRDQRPGFATADEETWLPDGRRIVPPTAD